MQPIYVFPHVFRCEIACDDGFAAIDHSLEDRCAENVAIEYDRQFLSDVFGGDVREFFRGLAREYLRQSRMADIVLDRLGACEIAVRKLDIAVKMDDRVGSC